MHTTMFNPFALVIGALIYPMTTLIVQWYFLRRKKTKTS
jgi:purine-cytosine permease-like protein